jgi:hypothetical protein
VVRAEPPARDGLRPGRRRVPRRGLDGDLVDAHPDAAAAGQQRARARVAHDDVDGFGDAPRERAPVAVSRAVAPRRGPVVGGERAPRRRLARARAARAAAAARVDDADGAVDDDAHARALAPAHGHGHGDAPRARGDGAPADAEHLQEPLDARAAQGDVQELELAAPHGHLHGLEVHEAAEPAPREHAQELRGAEDADHGVSRCRAAGCNELAGPWPLRRSK